jgi:predicted phage terminase large subunit-like protein
MEKTEPAVARSIVEHDVTWADIESNNGGRGFARNVEKIIREVYKSNRATIHWFHQNQNKQARILSNATNVMEHVYFPADWMYRWPEYYEDMIRYQRGGKNAHDDAQDATTGVVEKMTKRNRAQVKTFKGGI